MTNVSREQKIVQSVQDYLTEQLFTVRGYPTDQIEILEAWDGDSLPTPLAKNYIATGYGWDNGGDLAELGSTLITRLHTIEFFIFAKNMTWGRNLSSTVAMSLENDLRMPLKDIGEVGAPVIDYLLVESVSSQREPTPVDPPAWQKFVWTVNLKIRDEYFAAVT